MAAGVRGLEEKRLILRGRGLIVCGRRTHETVDGLTSIQYKNRTNNEVRAKCSKTISPGRFEGDGADINCKTRLDADHGNFRHTFIPFRATERV